MKLVEAACKIATLSGVVLHDHLSYFCFIISIPDIVNIFRVLINISLEHFRLPLKHVFRVDCHIPE